MLSRLIFFCYWITIMYYTVAYLHIAAYTRYIQVELENQRDKITKKNKKLLNELKTDGIYINKNMTTEIKQLKPKEFKRRNMAKFALMIHGPKWFRLSWKSSKLEEIVNNNYQNLQN